MSGDKLRATKINAKVGARAGGAAFSIIRAIDPEGNGLEARFLAYG